MVSTVKRCSDEGSVQTSALVKAAALYGMEHKAVL